MPTDSKQRRHESAGRASRGSGPRTLPRPESRREALIAAAIELFAHRPYRDVSVDEIVKRAGVAHGMVSYHFGGKRGLFAATVSYIWDDLVDVERRRDEESQPDQAVRGYLRRHFDYVSRYPDRYAILTQASQDNGDVEQILREARVSHLTELLDVIGCRSRLPPELIPALRGWNAFVDQVTLEWARSDLRDADVLVELCVQVLVTAVGVTDGFRFDHQTQLRALGRVTETLPAETLQAETA